MDTNLELKNAQAVQMARLIERALHDHSAVWEMHWHGLTVPAERAVSADRVVFHASFPAAPLPEGDIGLVWLGHNGTFVRAIEPPAGDGPLDFEWAFNVEQVDTEA